MAEQVIIEFIGDTTSLKEASKEINDMAGAEKSALGSANKAFKDHSDAKKKQIDLEKEYRTNLNKTIDDLAKTSNFSKQQLKDYANVVENIVGGAVKDLTGDVNKFAKQTDQATKAIVNQTKEGQNLKSRLKEIKAELSSMEAGAIAFDSKRFKELSKEAGNLQDSIGDVSQRVKVLASDTQKIDALISTAQGIAGAFSVAEGAAALFGSENENVQKALLKVQASMAILNGLQGVAAVLNKDSAFSVTVLTGAQNLFAAASARASAAVKFFGLSASQAWAVATLGLSLLIIAAVELIANFEEVTAWVRKVGVSFGILSDETNKATSALDDYVKSQQAFQREVAKSESSFKREIALMKLRGESSSDVLKKEKELALFQLQANKDRIDQLLQEQKQDGLNVAMYAQRAQEIAKLSYENQTLDATIKGQNKTIEEGDKKSKESHEKKKFQLKQEVADIERMQQLLLQNRVRNAELNIIAEKLGADDRIEVARLEMEKKKAEIDANVKDLILATAQKKLVEKEFADFVIKTNEDAQNEIDKKRQEGIKKWEEQDKKDAEDRAKAIEQFKSDMFQLGTMTFDFAKQMFSVINQLSKINSDQQLTELEDRRNLELSNTELTESQKLAINKRYDTEARKIKYEAAKADKEAKLASAIMGAAEAVIGAMKQGGPYAYVLAALAGAAAAAQVAIIARTPLPKFAKGTEYLQRGNNPMGVDTIPVLANEGERIVPTEINKQLKGIPNAMLPKLLMPSVSFYPKEGVTGGTVIDYDKLGSVIASKINDKPQAVVNVDKGGITTYLQSKGGKTTYMNNYFNN